MAHTCYSVLIHYVFSTKERQHLILPELRADLWAYMGGIARNSRMKALAVGGTDDHSHILLSLPAATSVAKAVQQIKAGSSLWMHGERSRPGFAWQEGYGAFSIGKSQVAETIDYILKQEEHHRRFDFQTEFLAFLKKHEIEYDPKYLWD
jgi:REP element-mobilizing transposase RayT